MKAVNGFWQYGGLSVTVVTFRVFHSTFHLMSLATRPSLGPFLLYHGEIHRTFQLGGLKDYVGLNQR